MQTPAAGADLRERYWLTRVVFLRCLGFIYFVAFLSVWRQWGPLLGSHGLLPGCAYLGRVGAAAGGAWNGALELPTLFWWRCSDQWLWILALIGVLLSIVVLLGWANALGLATLWVLYLSFVHVGQVFYGYGWEILLLETGFLAIFLCPLVDPRPYSDKVPPPRVVMWLLRWLAFRVMFGAGLIKLRGDSCWRDLTCMLYHYETQPLPNPFSWYMHHLPPWVHHIEVLGNHFVELIAPWGLFGPRRMRIAAGLVIIAFQLDLIVGGNLAFLNWLTITICIAACDDAALSPVVPRRLRARLAALPAGPTLPAWPRRAVTYALAALVAVLSIAPVRNMLGAQQVMNGSFEPLHLVNTYGAFGTIGRRRFTVVLQGTTDSVIGPDTSWQDYEYLCQPVAVDRRPCFIAPFQPRIDWQAWFAAMEDARGNPWLVHLVAKLLHGDPAVLRLMGANPFPAAPPAYIRAELYEYAFTPPGGRTWWTRRRIAAYLPPMAATTPALQRFLEAHGWDADQDSR